MCDAKMITKTFSQWAIEKRIDKHIRTALPYALRALKVNLNISRDEKLFLVGDFGEKNFRAAPILTAAYALAARRLKLNYRIIMRKGESPGIHEYTPILEEILYSGSGNAVISSLSKSFSLTKPLGKKMRRFFSERNHKFITTPGLGTLPTENIIDLLEAMSVNPHKLRKVGRFIKEKLDRGKTVKIITRRGTDLTFNIENDKALINDGLYTKKGSGGNLPAGETYIPFYKASVNGIAVIDASVRVKGRTLLTRKPLILDIKEGRVIRVKGEYAAALVKSFKDDRNLANSIRENNRIVELGIGTNPKASVIGPNLINEKTFGTAHIAVGNTSGVFGSVRHPIHLDQVFKDPLIKIDGKTLNFFPCR